MCAKQLASLRVIVKRADVEMKTRCLEDALGVVVHFDVIRPEAHVAIELEAARACLSSLWSAFLLLLALL